MNYTIIAINGTKIYVVFSPHVCILVAALIYERLDNVWDGEIKSKTGTEMVKFDFGPGKS